MQKISDLEPNSVFKYFEELSRIPRGSGNMAKISEYCMEFAKKHSLEALRDSANNVIIFKPATKGYENSEPVILQGHLDMVCQKEEGINIDFENEGLDIYVDGDYIKANGTTLGADNGIAVAMILSILESDLISHPPIEAIFTTDEEIGMIGASKLSLDKIKGRRMINIDSEDPKVLTVSCAGGSDFKMTVWAERKKVTGNAVSFSIKGLKGGHSGVEINSARVNANLLMGRILNHLKESFKFEIISIDGGDKGNAIPVSCRTRLLVDDDSAFVLALKEYADIIKQEISERESGFFIEIENEGAGEFDVIVSPQKEKIVYMLLCAPNGVIEMSAEIENLVETSLNLGILKTQKDNITMCFALRSNKKSALEFLEEKLKTFSACVECEVETGGHYPPWEYNSNSKLQDMYKIEFKKKFGFEPAVEAIHAGLECGVFAAQIENFDCISIGPEMHDIHTTCERLSISSTNDVYNIILSILKECK